MNRAAGEWLRWLDFRPTQPIQLVRVGVTSARAVEENRRLRAEDARKLILSQQQLIAAACRRNHQPTHWENHMTRCGSSAGTMTTWRTLR